MGDAEHQNHTRQFVEEQGLLWEGSGLSRIAGRIIGRLLICLPAEQTSAELARDLSASKGSISTNTRLLVQLGIIERTSRLGQRAVLFRIAPGAWGRLIRNEQARVTLFREGAERGLERLADVPGAERTRLEEFRDFYAFIEREYPLLLEHYEESRTLPESG